MLRYISYPEDFLQTLLVLWRLTLFQMCHNRNVRLFYS